MELVVAGSEEYGIDMVLARDPTLEPLRGWL